MSILMCTMIQTPLWTVDLGVLERVEWASWAEPQYRWFKSDIGISQGDKIQRKCWYDVNKFGAIAAVPKFRRNVPEDASGAMDPIGSVPSIPVQPPVIWRSSWSQARKFTTLQPLPDLSHPLPLTDTATDWDIHITSLPPIEPLIHFTSLSPLECDHNQVTDRKITVSQ